MNQLINQTTNTVNLDAELTKPITNQMQNKVTSFTPVIYPTFVAEPNLPSPFGVINRQTAKHWHFLDAQDELTRSFELIKVLRQHQADRRWTLLIAPSHIPDKALLECCSVDMSHVLIVREKQISSMFKTIETALKCNTCCAIVAWCSQWHTQLSNVKLQQLSKLADSAKCHVYAFNKQVTNESTSAANVVIEH